MYFCKPICENSDSNVIVMKPISAPFIGISRLRIISDGDGVTTLVAFAGCPLHCRYCLNPQCHLPDADSFKYFTPQSLYDEVKVDNLYFMATNGGITFGGGEPALHHHFISQFRAICGSSWKINLETCLNYPLSCLKSLMNIVDDYIIDCKDMNNLIYQQYTEKNNVQLLQNLKWMVANGLGAKTKVRVPLIPDYNTESDVKSSVKALESLGFTNIETFHYIIKNQQHEKRETTM